jgi:small-conductance mechanosensitive channel
MIQSVRLVMVEVGAEETALAIGFWVNLLVFVWLALIVIRCREGLQQIVRGGPDSQSPDERWLVGPYPAFALAAILGTWIAGLVAESMGKNEFILNGRHFLSLGLLLVVPMCDTLIRATVRLLVPPMQGSGIAAQTAFDAAFRSYVRVGRVVVFGTIILVLANLWGMSVVGLAEAGVGEQLGERVVVATLIMMVAYILLELVSLSINRRLSRIEADNRLPGIEEDEDRGPMGGGSSSRAGTVLPLIRWSLQAAILVVAVISALAQLGVNVTALLAGAGVAGIAIGFGAQKLVADLVSGVFFLLDDAFRVNEYIGAGSIEGTVEKIGLQSMHLRKSDGAIHCVPYSSVDTITNFSRDWGTSKLSFTVPFDTDIDRVRKIFKRIGQDILDNPLYADALLQPFKFKGVNQVTDLGIVVRGKFMFKPELAKQFLIQREIYRRVQSEFATAGIQFARRELRISVNSDDEIPSADVLQGQLGIADTAAPQT